MVVVNPFVSYWDNLYLFAVILRLLTEHIRRGHRLMVLMKPCVNTNMFSTLTDLEVPIQWSYPGFCIILNAAPCVTSWPPCPRLATPPLWSSRPLQLMTHWPSSRLWTWLRFQTRWMFLLGRTGEWSSWWDCTAKRCVWAGVGRYLEVLNVYTHMTVCGGTDEWRPASVLAKLTCVQVNVIAARIESSESDCVSQQLTVWR